MTLEELLRLENAAMYDFTNDGANEKYQLIADPIEKYFIYKAYLKSAKSQWIHRGEILYPEGYSFAKETHGVFAGIVDPDSDSKLLQEIYKMLWEEKHLEKCRCEKRVKADTMNSVQITLNETSDVFGLETKLEQLKKRATQNKYITQYAKAGYKLKTELEKIPGLRNFVSVYHTLGNFMPVPVGSNRPRGEGKTKDYWDLALKIIFDYYNNKCDAIADIVGNDDKRICNYKNWLNSFGSWDAFVEANYLQDFVSCCCSTSKYTMPKELWKNHFSSDSVLPKTEEEIEQFYTNVSSWILARGNRMLITLKEKMRIEEN